jgi:predicted amidohydrolase
VACVQTNSARDVEPNIEMASQLVRGARDVGAELILLPEIVNMFEPRKALALEKARTQDEDPSLSAFRALAVDTGAWLLIGSLALKRDDEMLANRSFLVAPDGAIAAQYDKVHMFDVEVGDGQTYRESAAYAPGARAVVAATPWGRLGMTVCYDVRFPYLYRSLAQAGAELISVPSAFTHVTGSAHWHVLLRARAIENGCFVLAPAQCGEHAEKRRTYGHSLIIDPWGEVLADGGEDVGFITADIDLSKVARARRKIPSLTHDRSIEEMEVCPAPGEADAAPAPRRA